MRKYAAMAVVVMGCALTLSWAETGGRGLREAAGTSTASKPAGTKPAATHPFRKQVKVEITEKFMIVKSDGIPDHVTGVFPNRTNPNTIKKQSYTFKIPLTPVKAEKVTKLPMGPIGVAVNGVPFYNPYTAEGLDAALNEVFDECCGHPDLMGRYHYHIYPKCVKTPFKKDEAGKHSELLGYAFDGFGIYGPLGEDGKAPKDLDECNGHEDEVRGYHYHVTDRFPYILGGYRGVVDKSNLDRGPRDAEGRPIRGSKPGGGDRQGPPRGGPGNGPPPPQRE